MIKPVLEQSKGNWVISVLSSCPLGSTFPFPQCKTIFTPFSQLVLTQNLFGLITIFTTPPPLNSDMSPGAYALKVKAAALLMLMFNVLMCQQPGTFCFSAASKDFNWKAELWEISRFVDRLVKIFWRNSVEALKPCHIGQGILYQFWSWVNSDKLCHQVPYIHFHGNASTKSLSLSLAVSFLSAYYIPGMIQVYSHGRN